MSLYTAAFSKGKAYRPLFYACMMFTQALAAGAVLANNLMVLLFFWEGIMGAMYGMIVSNGQKAQKTALKALMIAGATDLAMMLGIGLTGHLAKTLNMEQIHLDISGWSAVAYVLLMIGAISKAGSMPFHTWIPNAADDAPMPFMAFLPGALEKLLGIYLVTRLTLDLFQLQPGSPASLAMMILGVCVIILAVMMALIQRDFKAAVLPRGEPGGLHDSGHCHGAARGNHRRAVPYAQQRHLQVLPLFDRRGRGNRRAPPI